MVDEQETLQPTQPESYDLTKYSNLYLQAAEHGHKDLLKFLFAEELFGKRTLLMAMKKWFYHDLCGLIWSFVHVPLDVNHTNFRGMSGLMLSAKNGHIEIVKLLMKLSKLNLNIQDKSGTTALLHATRRGQWEIVKLLLDEPTLNVNLQDESGWTSLMIASRKGKMVDQFLERKDIDINLMDNEMEVSALILASKYGHAEAVDNLLYHESLDLSALTNEGETQYDAALLQAYEKNHTAIISILELDDCDDSYEC